MTCLGLRFDLRLVRAPLFCVLRGCKGQELREPSCGFYLLWVAGGSLTLLHLESTLKRLKEFSSGVLVLSHRKSLLLRASPGNSRAKDGHSQGCLLHL